ncbi:MAG: thioredoxin family protein [Candidatus Hydrogenedentes bacterium]|nr:thioredoxin family protein [Candidatus Hydrogenedentota bacterium]
MFKETKILFNSKMALIVSWLLLLFHCQVDAQWQATTKGPEIKFQIFAEKDKIKPGSTNKIVFQFILENKWHINSNKPLDEFLVPTQLSLEQSDIIKIQKVVYPEPKSVKLSFSEEPLSVFEGEFLIGVELKVGESAPTKKSIEIPFTLKYQACDDKQCLPPKTLTITYQINLDESETLASEETLKIINKVNWERFESPEASQPIESPENTFTENRSSSLVTPSKKWKDLIKSFNVIGRLDGYANKSEFLGFIEDTIERKKNNLKNKTIDSSIYTLLLIVIGGLALNLTPCVLPVIPLNIAIIGAGARAGSKIKGLLLGGAYGAGIALVYGGLGIAVVLGFSKTFGTINSTAWFNTIISILFFLLGLAMFDVFLLDFSKFQSNIKLDKFRKGSFTLAFIMGGISALLAGACVAPVVISTIIHAQDLYSQGYKIALFMPLLLGVGMALPWPFLGAGLTLMPKPGKWTEYVKYAFGVLLILISIYYGYTAYTIYTVKRVEETSSDWYTSLEPGLEESQKTGRPLIIDFWATWCKNCIVMNKRVLTQPEVKEKLSGFVKVKFQAENPNSPEIRDVLEHFQVLGLPTFIILSPKK